MKTTNQFIHLLIHLRDILLSKAKKGRCSAWNHYYESTISDEVFNIISKELNINGNICETLDNCFECTNKHKKLIENGYDSQFEDYWDIKEEEGTNHINKEVNKLIIHKKIQKLNINDVLMDFDSTSLYPSATLDEKSVYPKVETGFAFKPHMNKTFVDAFNIQTLNQDGFESAILRMNFYNPPALIFQHLTVKGSVKKIEGHGMRNGYIIDPLTSVDTQESFKLNGKVIQIYERVFYRQNFKKSPFRKVIEKLFALRQKYNDEGNDLMQGLVLNCLYGAQIRKDIDQFYNCKSEHWMQTEYDENVLDFWKIPNGNFIVKVKDDDGLEDANNVKNTLLSHLGAFILSNRKRKMKNFSREINGFYNINIYSRDMDSLYI